MSLHDGVVDDSAAAVADGKDTDLYLALHAGSTATARQTRPGDARRNQRAIVVAEVVGVDGAQVGQGLPEDIRRATAGHRLECGVGVDDEPVCIGDENGFHGLFHHGGKTGDLLFGAHVIGEIARHGKDGTNHAVSVEFGHEMGIEAAHFLVEGQVIPMRTASPFSDLCQRATPEVHQLMRKRRLVDGRTRYASGVPPVMRWTSGWCRCSAGRDRSG